MKITAAWEFEAGTWRSSMRGAMLPTLSSLESIARALAGA